MNEQSGSPSLSSFLQKLQAIPASGYAVIALDNEGRRFEITGFTYTHEIPVGGLEIRTCVLNLRQVP
jgi:hypothetical protein